MKLLNHVQEQPGVEDPFPRRRVRLIRFSELKKRVPLSRTTVWRLVRAGTFPKPIKLAANVSAWREDEIDAWIELRSA